MTPPDCYFVIFLNVYLWWLNFHFLNITLLLSNLRFQHSNLRFGSAVSGRLVNDTSRLGQTASQSVPASPLTAPYPTLSKNYYCIVMSIQPRPKMVIHPLVNPFQNNHCH